MSSISEPFTESPISRVPYDILSEIFIHCLPRYPLRCRQPDATIAPILLCHICSSWRMTALTSTSLWTHLSYCLTIVGEDDSRLVSRSRTINFIAREIEFIQWWRLNHGHIAPFLKFSVRYSDNMAQKLTGDEMSFVLEYASSVQYLQLSAFYWTQIEERISAGYQIAFPNLRILKAEHTWAINDPFYQAVALLPNHAFPALRYLSIGDTIMIRSALENFHIPSHWFALTHVHLCTLISLDFWYSFSRAVPNLQWGYFNVNSPSNTNYEAPLQCTLHRLTTLIIALHTPYDLVFPLNAVFTNLYLPALRTLSLSSDSVKSWEDHNNIAELYGVLKFTPAITKLSLENNFLSARSVVPAAVQGVEPIWNHATQLVHLQLHLRVTKRSKAETEAVVDLFVRKIFSSDSGWLDLSNPACPIRLLMVNDRGSTYYLKDLIISSIRKIVENAPRLVLQTTEASAMQVALHVRNEWGSRN